MRRQKKRSREIINKILEIHPQTNKQLLSQVFGVCRRWLYQKISLLQHKDAVLKEQILSVLSEFPSYGYRRISVALCIGKKRVRRCMKLYGIKPYKRKSRWSKRRDKRGAPAVFQNQIKNHCPLTPNHTWVGDFTYLPFKGKFLYLATFMDLFTREIVGWNISKKHTKDLVIQAFLNSLVNRQLERPQFVHSDQGCEYTAKDYTDLIEQFGITVSMSKKASPWENGYQESFFNNFKTDLGLEFDRFESEGHFLEAIHHTLHTYNHKRIHSALNMPPIKFHTKYLHSLCTKRGA